MKSREPLNAGFFQDGLPTDCQCGLLIFRGRRMEKQHPLTAIDHNMKDKAGQKPCLVSHDDFCIVIEQEY